jgi:hypothetical protein
MNTNTNNSRGTNRYSCAEVRYSIGAEPQEVSAALAQHLAECVACRQFQAETLRLEVAIRAALDLVPAAAPRTAPVAPLPVKRRLQAPQRWALAASVLLALAVGVFLWTGRPAPSLAADLVAHMAEEPESWGQTSAVPESVLAFVLRKSGVRLMPGPSVVYAHSCLFRGQWVPHLVVQTSAGPVTVMVLPGERVAERQTFADGGYSGVIEPGAGGSIALLVRGDTNVDQIAAEVARAVVWRG